MTTTTRITWLGQGGELDAVTALDDGDEALTRAIVKMISGHVVSPGDSIIIEEIGS